MHTGSETGKDEGLKMEFTRKIPGYGYSKNLSCDPAYCSLGVGVCRIAADENTVCRRDRDQSMPGCESSCRVVFAVWNRDQGIPGGILRPTGHRRWPVFLWHPS